MYRTDYTGGLDVEGPFGIRMREKAAVELETVLKADDLKDAAYRRYVVDDLEYTKTKDRSDVSWLTKESPDRQREIILTDGINDSVIRRNNIVTINHELPAIGENKWLKKEEIDGKKGMKAETRYLPAPQGWDSKDKWVGDAIFNLVVQKALSGKSVGILPVPNAIRAPTQQEVDEHPDWHGCKVYERSYLVEYAVCHNPVHPDAVTLTVCKAFPDDADQLLGLLGLEKKADPPEEDTPLEPPPKPTVDKSDPGPRIQMIPITAIPVLVNRMLANYDLGKLSGELAKHAIYKKTGKIL